MMVHDGHPPTASTAAHWDRLHRSHAPSSTSWFAPAHRDSVHVLDELGVTADHGVLDVGAGASGIAGALLDRGFTDVTALDISAEALASARAHLDGHAATVDRIVADVLDWTPHRRWDVWHDRAVFHFLLAERDVRRYRSRLDAALVPGGLAVVATFAADGPAHCSGLPVRRYDADDLAAALGPGLVRVATRRVEHRTPDGVVQPFTYLALRRPASGGSTP